MHSEAFGAQAAKPSSCTKRGLRIVRSEAFQVSTTRLVDRSIRKIEIELLRQFNLNGFQ